MESKYILVNIKKVVFYLMEMMGCGVVIICKIIGLCKRANMEGVSFNLYFVMERNLEMIRAQNIPE